MGEMIQFKRPDGKTCPGYLALPKAGSSAPGFVVIQEWWGLNDQIEKTVDPCFLLPSVFTVLVLSLAKSGNPPFNK